MKGVTRPRIVLVMQIGIYREALAGALRGCGLEVEGCASPGPEAAAMVRTSDAEVVLVDVSRSVGIATLRELTAATPEVRLLAIGVCDLDPDVLVCIEAGAVGYVVRDASLDELTDAVRRAVRDEPLASPQVVATLMRRVAYLAANGKAGSVDGLTARELEVVELIEKGLSNKEIALQLSIAVTTVKNHVHSILEKLQVQRRGEAASLVRSSGSKGSTYTGAGLRPGPVPAQANLQPRRA